MRLLLTKRKAALMVALTLLMVLSASCASRWTAPTRTPAPSPTYSVPNSSIRPGSASERFDAISKVLTKQSVQGAAGPVTVEMVYDSPEFFRALAETQATAGKDAAATLADYQAQYKLNETMVFSVYLNTHSVDLSSLKIEKLATLKDDAGHEVSALNWQEDSGGSGHHRSGELFFPRLDMSQAHYVEVVLANVAGVPARIFRWDLPIAYPGGGEG